MMDDNMPDVQPDLKNIEWNAAIEAVAEWVDNTPVWKDIYGDDIRKLKK